MAESRSETDGSEPDGRGGPFTNIDGEQDEGLPGGPVTRLHAPSTGGPGWIPGQGTRSHVP